MGTLIGTGNIPYFGGGPAGPAAATHTDLVLAQSPLLYYDMGALTTTEPQLGSYANGGTYLGSPTLDGSPVAFDGVNDWLSTVTAVSQDWMQTQLTYEAVVDPSTIATAPCLFHSGSLVSAANMGCWGAITTGGEFKLGTYSSGTYRSFDSIGAALSAGNKYHLTVTYSTATNSVKFYKNGVYLNTVTYTGIDFNALAYPFLIGAQQNPGPTHKVNLFAGDYYSFAYYDKVLDDTTILNLATAAMA